MMFPLTHLCFDHYICRIKLREPKSDLISTLSRKNVLDLQYQLKLVRIVNFNQFTLHYYQAFNKTIACHRQIRNLKKKNLRCTGCPKKNFAVVVLGAEGTIFVQFSQSMQHWKGLHFSYLKVFHNENVFSLCLILFCLLHSLL